MVCECLLLLRAQTTELILMIFGMDVGGALDKHRSAGYTTVIRLFFYKI